MGTNEHQRDNKLVIVADGKLDEDFFDTHRNNFHFVDRRESGFRSLGFDFMDTLTEEAMSGSAFSAHFRLRERVEDIVYWKAEEKARLKKMQRIIAEQKLKIAVLINSEGGKINILEPLLVFLESMRNKGNEVFTFGGERMRSAGAGLFVATDPERRFATPRSELLFHLISEGYIAAGDEWHLTAEGVAHKYDLQKKLIGLTRKRFRGEMRRILEKAFSDREMQVSPDCPIVLNGGGIERFGFAAISAKHGSSLRGQFEAALGVTAEQYSGGRVGAFFNKTDVLEKPVQ